MIRINPLFFIVLGITFIFGIAPQFLSVTAIAVIHEGAHAFCAYFCGCENLKFKIQPWGVCMTCDAIKNAKKELIIALAGPASNFFLLLFSGLIDSNEFYFANLFMLVINLLPVYPLDGGRILEAILKSEFSSDFVHIMLRVCSVIVTIIILISGSYLFYKTKINFSVLLIALFLSFSCDRDMCAKERKTISKAKHYLVEGSNSADIVLKMNGDKNNAVFDITDVSGRYIGSVTYKQIMESIALFGYEIKFDEILQKQLLY